MTNPQSPEAYLDRTVVDPAGNKIGSVGQVYVNDDSGVPDWITVNTGLFGLKEHFAPLQGSSFTGEDLVLPFDKDVLKDAPHVDDASHLDPDEQVVLYAYYESYLTSGTQVTRGNATDATLRPRAEGVDYDADRTDSATGRGYGTQTGPVGGDAGDAGLADAATGRGYGTETDRTVSADDAGLAAAATGRGYGTETDRAAAGYADDDSAGAEVGDGRGYGTETDRTAVGTADTRTDSDDTRNSGGDVRTDGLSAESASGTTTASPGGESLTSGTRRTDRPRLRKYVVIEQRTVIVPLSEDEGRDERGSFSEADPGDARAIGEASDVEGQVALADDRPVVATEASASERDRLGREAQTGQQSVRSDDVGQSGWDDESARAGSARGADQTIRPENR